MIYTVKGKSQSTFDSVFGGGVRHQVELQTKRPDGSDDQMTTIITVDANDFAQFHIGQTVAIMFGLSNSSNVDESIEQGLVPATQGLDSVEKDTDA